ncbi:MepB family protein [uncultured Enterococcus sp.]|uniref:MepB family protein n=1 Tax=uncultured Enterococcus sp. TaxID=167972 RepID=UPI00258ABADC|nr:MepB family protein [uncultured Enterococcus sp.]
MYASLTYLNNQLVKDSLQHLQLEKQNDAYEGATFSLEGTSFRSRRGKLTPKKKGYFVAFWEKDPAGTNHPFSYEDSPEKVIVTVLDAPFSGHFIFPKKRLLEKGILKGPDTKGKMALRVYPTWEQGLNKTARMTQSWQIEYFTDTSENRGVEKDSLLDGIDK